MKRQRINRTTGGAMMWMGAMCVGLSAASLIGCEEKANPVQATTPPPAAQPVEPPSSPGRRTTSGFRQPALGKAKEASKNTLDEAARRHEELMRELEDDG